MVEKGVVSDPLVHELGREGTAAGFDGMVEGVEPVAEEGGVDVLAVVSVGGAPWGVGDSVKTVYLEVEFAKNEDTARTQTFCHVINVRFVILYLHRMA